MGTIFEEFNKICDKYAENSSENNLNALLDIYQYLVPDWTKEFNNHNKRLTEQNKKQDKIFEEFLKVQLPNTYTVNNLKVAKNEKEDIFIDIMQRGRIIHLSNKIAHKFEYAMDSRIKKYMNKAVGMTSDKIEKQFDDIKKLVKKVYDDNNKHEVKEKAKHILCLKYGFNETDFKNRNLNSLNIPQLIKAYNNGMNIKDTEIQNVDRLAHSYNMQNISYGIKKEEHHNLFVMDIPKFGQFSVHMVDPEMIKQIKRQYTMPIYTKETYMLVNYQSKKAKEFIKEAKIDDSMDEERGISKELEEFKKIAIRLREEIKFLGLTKAQKHELAVRTGLQRRDLEEIENEREDR